MFFMFSGMLQSLYLLPARDLTAGGCFNCSLLRFCCGRSASVSGRSTNSEGVTIREAQWMLRWVFGMSIYRNCNVLPLCLGDLLNHTILMLKFCTNKPIWALLVRQIFFLGGEGGILPIKWV